MYGRLLCSVMSSDLFSFVVTIEKWACNGVITLRTAFSRDQPQKVYVQHLLEEDSKLIWDLVHHVSV